MDLSTEYLGLKLNNPLVPSASPLGRNLDTAKQLEDNGASALVMYSLFEEEIRLEEQELERLMSGQSLGIGEADSYLPVQDSYLSIIDLYLEQLAALKNTLDIPVIASLNGVSNGGWVEYAGDIESAGANALELNIYYVPVDINESGEAVESRYVNILKSVREQVKIPITCKINSQFSSLGHFIKRLEDAGANGVSIFNRFYQPSINIESLEVQPTLHLSKPEEMLLRMHWIAILRGNTGLSLAATGGVHDATAVIKLLLAGADITHMCSALLMQGPKLIKTVLEDVASWMEENEYDSVSQLKGSVSRGTAMNPEAYGRLNYLEVMRSMPG
ncbi:MAG: dihydroorotate dehydrogenase-like protein [Granulosicoccus sp.]